MDIKLQERKVVERKEETHYKVIINGKEVWVNKWYEDNEFGFEGDTEIIGGKELLTEEEQEVVLDYINEALAESGL